MPFHSNSDVVIASVFFRAVIVKSVFLGCFTDHVKKYERNVEVHIVQGVGARWCDFDWSDKMLLSLIWQRLKHNLARCRGADWE